MKLKINCSQPSAPPQLVPLTAQELADLQAGQLAQQQDQQAQETVRKQRRDALAAFTSKAIPTPADAITALKTLIAHLGADS